jgi:hypothetical protein
MRTIINAELEVLSVRQAASITGLSRNTIAAAMDKWTLTGGRMGLRFIRPNERRLVRRSELLAWFEGQERTAAYG